jgi:hypothetical protein
MELVELVDRCLYEDELRDILLTIGEDPDGQKRDLIKRLLESKKDPAEIVSLIDQDMLTIVCLESGVPYVLDREQMLDYVLQDVLGEVHDYTEIKRKVEKASSDNLHELDRELCQVDFDNILDDLGEWTPVNTFLPRAVISEELARYLDGKGYPIRTRAKADIRVGNNISIELARGQVPKDIDSLLGRMVEDLTQYQYTIGVMYGVERESIVEQLEEALEVFEEPDRVAIVLI